jgi:hypothetical protein
MQTHVNRRALLAGAAALPAMSVAGVIPNSSPSGKLKALWSPSGQIARGVRAHIRPRRSSRRDGRKGPRNGL